MEAYIHNLSPLRFAFLKTMESAVRARVSVGLVFGCLIVRLVQAAAIRR